MIGGAIAALTAREDGQFGAKETGPLRTRQELRVRADQKLIDIRTPTSGCRVTART